ncbi:acyl-CoA N-acyltransferase [Mycena galericulata]|nr:acyl-CoA N-acyltransferase [Mycena galericulata]
MKHHIEVLLAGSIARPREYEREDNGFVLGIAADGNDALLDTVSEAQDERTKLYTVCVTALQEVVAEKQGTLHGKMRVDFQVLGGGLEGSVALVAKRRFLCKPPSLVAYLLGGAGLGLLSRPGRWRVAGALLCTAGIALFAAVQHSIVQGLTLFCEETLKADMRDISESYRSPAAFFVAARPREAGVGPGSRGEEPEEVVGYVGFEYLPEKDASQAEVRRMIVSERHRRRGIAERLMRALIAHAETVPGLKSIELGTSEFQPGARRLYERLGWEVFRAEEMGHKFLTLTVRHFRRPVGKRDRLGFGVKLICIWRADWPHLTPT